jgi:SAM-dependent methyltransferase
MVDPVAWYDGNAETVSARYEGVTSEDLHGWMLDLLPATPATILDVGAGSGRDASWLAAKGYDVIAVEPSANMRAAAAQLHPEARVHWINDTLPALGTVTRSGLSFDLVLLSAVWSLTTLTVLRQQIRSCPTGLVAARVDQPPPDQARSALRWKTPTNTTAEFSASRHTRISPYMKKRWPWRGKCYGIKP